MNPVRPLIAVCLSLMLVLTSGAMAVARGQATAAGSVVLCTGAGPVAIQVDAQGQPTGPVHICPDCALSLLDAAATGPDSPSVDLAATPLDRPAPSAETPQTHAPNAQARAPPAV